MATSSTTTRAAKTTVAARDMTAEIVFLTRALKARTLRDAVSRLAARARAESWSHEEFLAACLQREDSARESHGGEGRVRAARLPARKSLEDFDFEHARGLKRDLIAHLGTLDFVTARENIVFLGPPGTGWQQLDAEVKDHEKLLTELTTALTPQLVDAFGVGPDTAAELLIVAGDNIDRVRSEPAWARLCGVAPIPASSGMTTRHRLNRGGHRQANSALYRSVIVRMQHHEPTKPYVARRTAEGKTKAEIIRCLKRLLAREIWALMRPLRAMPAVPPAAA